MQAKRNKSISLQAIRPDTCLLSFARGFIFSFTRSLFWLCSLILFRFFCKQKNTILLVAGARAPGAARPARRVGRGATGAARRARGAAGAALRTRSIWECAKSGFTWNRRHANSGVYAPGNLKRPHRQNGALRALFLMAFLLLGSVNT